MGQPGRERVFSALGVPLDDYTSMYLEKKCHQKKKRRACLAAKTTTIENRKQRSQSKTKQEDQQAEVEGDVYVAGREGGGVGYN